MTGTDQTWRPEWAPPLDPPVDGGLPAEQAEQIALDHPGANPHLIAALQWEAYAAQLPPGPQVTAVTTGAQSVQYAEPANPFALAMARADWHRSFLRGLGSITLTVWEDRELCGAGWWR